MRVPSSLSPLLLVPLTLAAVAARADLTLTRTVSVRNSREASGGAAHRRSLPAGGRRTARTGKTAQRTSDLAAGRPTIVTTYLSGDRGRVDTGSVSLLYDRKARTAFLIDRAARRYAPAPIASVQKMVALVEPKDGPLTLRGAGSIRDTGQTAVVGGRAAHRYLVPVGTKASEAITVWISPDAPTLAAPWEEAEVRHVSSAFPGHPGLIVLISLSKSTPSDGRTDVRLTNTLSTAPLPASVFAVPAGYARQTPLADAGK